MANVVVVGGGVAGLATALAAAGDGHDVTVLERGAPPPPGHPAEAGEAWERPTSPQVRHAHTVTSLGVAALREHAPELLADLLDAGAGLIDMTRAMPPDPAGPRPDDAELVALACRRATFDVVLHRHVAALPRVRLRHHTRVLGLALAPAGDRVAGVRLARDEVVPADVVVDATGRRALGREWLADLGIELPADLSGPNPTCAYVRFYRRTGPGGALNRGNAAGVLADGYACVLHVGDNDTFSIAFGALPTDAALRRLRDPAAFEAAARATPFVRDWLGDGRAAPVTDVRVMTTPPNTLRALATTPSPVAGLLPAGDAACVTDPMFGRGVSLALVHGFRIAALLRAHPVVGPALSRAAARLAGGLFTPWYRQACTEAHDRISRWQATVAGGPAPAAPPGPLWVAAAAGTRDAQVWRGVVRVLMGLRTPEATFADEEFTARVRDALAPGPPPPPRLPGRAELLAVTAREGEPHAHAGSGPR